MLCLHCLGKWSRSKTMDTLIWNHTETLHLLLWTLLTNCSSTKLHLCFPHNTMHSNRLVLWEASAGELPLHSALLWLSLPFVVPQKLQPHILNADVLTHCRKARVSTHSSLLHMCFEVPVKVLWMTRKMPILFSILSGVWKIGLKSSHPLDPDSIYPLHCMPAGKDYLPV